MESFMYSTGIFDLHVSWKVLENQLEKSQDHFCWLPAWDFFTLENIAWNLMVILLLMEEIEHQLK